MMGQDGVEEEAYESDSYHNKGQMPRLGNVVWIVENCQALNLGSSKIGGRSSS
jgi:hypothetical protein